MPLFLGNRRRYAPRSAVMKHSSNFNRRRFLQTSSAALASTAFLASAQDETFAFRYIVGSSMYGELPLAEILREVNKTGAQHIDIWPRKHGNQREQVEEMKAVKVFTEELKPHADAAGEAGVRIGIENHANNLIDSADSLKWLIEFGPQVAALKKINYSGYTEIFMHSVPRGIPILPTAAETTAEIIRSRDYLEKF